jgi:hypothetical protein
MKRFVLLLLVVFLVFGFADHLFSVETSAFHLLQETNCPVHGGAIPLERAGTLLSVTTMWMGEMQDNTKSFNLTIEISHPPTI